MTKMIAFHGDPSIKAKYLDRLHWHRLADEIVQGTGFDGRRGCGVGCTLDSYDHSRYPAELGIPLSLAFLEDAIHEGLPDPDFKDWPSLFLASIPVGADLALVEYRFKIWLLTCPQLGLESNALPDGKAAIGTVVALLERMVLNDPPTADQWSAARSAAESAESAESAARSAAESAESAESAARSAAESAESAARSAARSARSAESAVWKASRDQLLAILAEAPIFSPVPDHAATSRRPLGGDAVAGPLGAASRPASPTRRRAPWPTPRCDARRFRSRGTTRSSGWRRTAPRSTVTVHMRSIWMTFSQGRWGSDL